MTKRRESQRILGDNSQEEEKKLSSHGKLVHHDLVIGTFLKSSVVSAAGGASKNHFRSPNLP